MLIDLQFNVGIVSIPGVYEGEDMLQAPTPVPGCHCNALCEGELPEALDYALLPANPATPAREYAGPLAPGVTALYLWWPDEAQARADLAEAGWDFTDPNAEGAQS